MPGTVTTALFRQVSAETGTPIVNLFYDGTGSQNRSLEVYLRTALNADAGPAAETAGRSGIRARTLSVSPAR
jgi:hypothetical protein